MDRALFLADLEAIPASLEAFAEVVQDGTLWPLTTTPRRLLLTGMGSSYFAASVAAGRLRAAGIDAAAELASSLDTWPASPDLVVVPISATGRSAETLTAVEPHRGISTVVALTNDATSPLALLADSVVDMAAGVEAGGVACRSYRHTLAALLALEAQLTGAQPPAESLRRAASGTQRLLDHRGWLGPALDALDSPDGTWVLAPAERLGSALQGALMMREGPRRRADGCETGDWSHVDVYLTKTLDYRALVFAGSRYDAAAADWMAARGSKVVAVGGPFPGAAFDVRYAGDDDRVVAMLTEVLVAELVAASWWAATPTV